MGLAHTSPLGNSPAIWDILTPKGLVVSNQDLQSSSLNSRASARDLGLETSNSFSRFLGAPKVVGTQSHYGIYLHQLPLSGTAPAA